MKENYTDITSRIDEEPKWYDMNGTPRYDKFHPEMCPNIYARRVVLLRISCQNCGDQFLVEMHDSIWGFPFKTPHNLHYGDPPIHGCVGDTMNCYDLELMEVWEKYEDFEYKRRKDLEGIIGVCEPRGTVTGAAGDEGGRCGAPGVVER